MDREQLEFQISQYADGTLPAGEVAALEATLASDSEARSLLDEYRALDIALKRELAVPDMNWDRLASHLSDAVAKEDDATRVIAWPMRFGRIAIAAMVLLAIGSAMWHFRTRPAQIAINPGVEPTIIVAEVAGPAPEAATQPAFAEITIGPSPLAQQAFNPASETIVYRPSRIVIASGQSDRQDTQRLPY